MSNIVSRSAMFNLHKPDTGHGLGPGGFTIPFFEL